MGGGRCDPAPSPPGTDLDVVCARDKRGEWHEIEVKQSTSTNDAGVAESLTVLRWIPRAEGVPLAAVSGPGTEDLATFDPLTLANQVAEMMQWDGESVEPRDESSAETHRSSHGSGP